MSTTKTQTKFNNVELQERIERMENNTKHLIKTPELILSSIDEHDFLEVIFGVSSKLLMTFDRGDAVAYNDEELEEIEEAIKRISSMDDTFIKLILSTLDINCMCVYDGVFRVMNALHFKVYGVNHNANC